MFVNVEIDRVWLLCENGWHKLVNVVIDLVRLLFEKVARKFVKVMIGFKQDPCVCRGGGSGPGGPSGHQHSGAGRRRQQPPHQRSAGCQNQTFFCF